MASEEQVGKGAVDRKAPRDEEGAYDEVLEESFPASDPPPGVIHLGPPPAAGTHPHAAEPRR